MMFLGDMEPVAKASSSSNVTNVYISNSNFTGENIHLGCGSISKVQTYAGNAVDLNDAVFFFDSINNSKS